MTVIDDRTGLQTDTSTFVTRMKRYRTMAKLSIAKLADYLKREYGELALSENVLTNIELGRKTDISVDATIQIAHALHITPLALICDLEEPFLLSDNPIFGTRTKYGICNIFLSEMIVFDRVELNTAMARIKSILDESKRYWDGVSNYQTYMDVLRRALLDELPDDSDDPMYYGPGPNMAFYYLSQSIDDIEKSATVMEAAGVTVPDSEKKKIETAKDSFDSIRKMRIAKGILSLDEQERISDVFEGISQLPSKRPLTSD